MVSNNWGRGEVHRDGSPRYLIAFPSTLPLSTITPTHSSSGPLLPLHLSYPSISLHPSTPCLPTLPLQCFHSWRKCSHLLLSVQQRMMYVSTRPALCPYGFPAVLPFSLINGDRFSLSVSQLSITSTQAMKCCSSWVQFGLPLPEMSTLIDHLFQSLLVEDLFTQACETLTEISSHHDSLK